MGSPAVVTPPRAPVMPAGRGSVAQMLRRAVADFQIARPACDRTGRCGALKPLSECPRPTKSAAIIAWRSDFNYAGGAWPGGCSVQNCNTYGCCRPADFVPPAAEVHIVVVWLSPFLSIPSQSEGVEKRREHTRAREIARARMSPLAVTQQPACSSDKRSIQVRSYAVARPRFVGCVVCDPCWLTEVVTRSAR